MLIGIAGWGFLANPVLGMFLFCVGLIETLRTDLEFQIFHGFIDEVCSLECNQIKIIEGVVTFLIVYIYKRGDLRECVRDML